MPYDSDALLATIRTGGIQADLHEHPPVLTVEEMMEVCGDIKGAHTKNLFLRDGKKNYFLVTLPHDARLDLKALRPVLGAKGGLSFASDEALREKLHVISGAVSPLAAMNDAAGIVTVFIESSLLAEERINVHPLTSDRTLSIRPGDLVDILTAHGHAPHAFVLSVSEAVTEPADF
ncbi:prolyl-tRNA synthetase associated domain-containing protein [Methylobacterium nodulans]|uniref:YbaK/prolyl-tRNA synthetase associated region n=1 Tax=Methylobacterium nodulans (strain LMG 21967 / CNCM I-2342 / ORS 2060) TaxID=460265 RepID=B8IMD3_METNO|nr:prolyl-tRNA synthetase associated domain-containing protein [Methylobacterium nodulans]ACL58319.1 YbaK/prolyl-tRNA synthetase associated region [Methylobacterium nodulans ORS 2060]